MGSVLLYSAAYCRLFEVVEHALFEDEPTPVFRLVLSSFLCEPALTFRVEEGLRQVPLSPWYLEFLTLYILIQLLRRRRGRGVKKKKCEGGPKGLQDNLKGFHIDILTTSLPLPLPPPPSPSSLFSVLPSALI